MQIECSLMLEHKKLWSIYYFCKLLGYDKLDYIAKELFRQIQEDIKKIKHTIESEVIVIEISLYIQR